MLLHGIVSVSLRVWTWDVNRRMQNDGKALTGQRSVSDSFVA